MAYNFISENGVIIPDTADTRAEVEQEWRDDFGRQDLVTTPDTPQGVLITQEVVARQAVARNNADLANQINPNLAGGVFLDAICALMGLQRKGATKTRVYGVSIGGIPKTMILAGSRARTEAGDVFYALKDTTIGTDGTTSCDFEAAESGAVFCDAGTLNEIMEASLLGWETVTNPSAGQIGQERETDEQLFMRRKLTLARQGISSVEAHISGLYDLPGVRSLSFRENISSETQTIDGMTMLPHSVWVCVDGGIDSDIALSLLTSKTNGAAWNGEVAVKVTEPYSGQTYTVLFDRPILLLVVAKVTVSATNFSGDAQFAVRDAIMRYVAGEIKGERAFVVGENVSPYELAWAINWFYPGIFVRKVEIAFSGDDYGTDELPVAVNEMATITPNTITVV
ncbi:MAG: baseplate J/gp47 family protein [Candidatus Accumulibacter sp.]|jgi:hypothetical protein|nr:baseplate J/gp47 family protein [Accumulibacter sp.]